MAEAARKFGLRYFYEQLLLVFIELYFLILGSDTDAHNNKNVSGKGQVKTASASII